MPHVHMQRRCEVARCAFIIPNAEVSLRLHYVENFRFLMRRWTRRSNTFSIAFGNITLPQQQDTDGKQLLSRPNNSVYYKAYSLLLLYIIHFFSN